MQKKTFVLLVSVAMALCAMGFAAPAAALEGPTGGPTPRSAPVPSLPRTFAGLDALIDHAMSRLSGGTGPAAASPSPPGAPPRAAALARSLPRPVSSYDSPSD